jgi:hypothetical protein
MHIGRLSEYGKGKGGGIAGFRGQDSSFNWKEGLLAHVPQGQGS